METSTDLWLLVTIVYCTAIGFLLGFFGKEQILQIIGG